jgi:hypothetical protein
MRTRIISLLLITGITFTCAAYAQQRERVEVENEGLWQAREEAIAARRQNPNDPLFNTALARLGALTETRSRQITSLPPQIAALLPSASWQNIGPAPTLAGQTPTSSPRFPSPVSGRTNVIAFDTIDNAIYIGAAQGGVWRSFNRGATWSPLTDSLGALAIGAIAVDPTVHSPNQGTVYVGTGEANGSADSYAGTGMYKSFDSGRTWAGPFGSSSFLGRAISSVVIDRTNTNIVLVGTQAGAASPVPALATATPFRGIYRSIDGGLTYTLVTTAATQTPISKIIQDPIVATTFWAAAWYTGLAPTTAGGLLKSIDSGVTWTQVAGTGGLPAQGSTLGRSWITAAAAAADTQSTLYWATSQTNTSPIPAGKIFKSIDGGTNWTELTAGQGFCQGQCFYDMPIYAEPGDPTILYTGGAGASGAALPTALMRSNNGGTSFTDIVRSADSTTAMHADVHNIVTWPGIPNEVYVVNDGGVWSSTDRGTNWKNLNDGLATLQFSGCDVDTTAPNRFYGGTQDNGTMGSENGSRKWQHLDFGDGGNTAINQANPNELIHTYFNQTNNLIGAGFTRAGFATTQGFYNGSFAAATNGNGIALTDRVQFYAPILLDRSNRTTFYFGTNKLYRANDFFNAASTAGGVGIFTALGLNQDLAPTTGSLTAIETVANGTSNANIIFTGSNIGRMFKSSDGGATAFTEIDVGGSPLFISDILVDPRNTNVVYASRAGFRGMPGKNVRKSLDGGSTWADAAIGLPDIPVQALTFDPYDSNRVWVGTDVGMFVTVDGGANWVPFNDGMPNVAVFDLKTNPNNGTILACTHGRSAFRLQLVDDNLLFANGFE